MLLCSYCLQELESRTKALQDKYEELRKEVAQRQLEVRYFIQLLFRERTCSFSLQTDPSVHIHSVSSQLLFTFLQRALNVRFNKKQCSWIFYVLLIKIVPIISASCLFSLHRSLLEDVETHEAQILKEQKELGDKKEIIELKEVCVWELVCVCVWVGIAYSTPSIE